MKESVFDFVSEFNNQQENLRHKKNSSSKSLDGHQSELNFIMDPTVLKNDNQNTISVTDKKTVSPKTSDNLLGLSDSYYDELSNKEAFDLLISRIRKSSNAERDIGTKFETLVIDWLTRDEAYSDLFSKVQTYKDWANEHHDLVTTARDTGIDLVGTNSDDDMHFTAIQCKMYGLEYTVSKADIDSFISASDKSYFTRRFIVATNQRWSENVLNDLMGKSVPVTVITHNELVSSSVDWSAYMKGQKASVKKRTLRPYQRAAIDGVKLGFRNADRGKMIMACGTGKTFTSMKLVEEYIGAGRLVLFLVPSLALLSQTLADWKRQCSIHINAFAVCSDSTTGKANPEDDDYLTSVDQLAYPATTNAVSLATHVNWSLQRRNELTVIFSTYQSIGVLHEAQFANEMPVPEFDLVICDEAHRTAGVSWKQDDEESNFVRVHDNSFIKAKKRLYMTATPKVYGSVPKQQAESGGDLVLYSMDDESIFGKELATVSFTKAIDEGCLVDYKVIVLTVDESLLERDYDFLSTDEEGGLSVNSAAKIVGTWRALTKMDIRGEGSLAGDIQQMRRAVGFAQVISPSEKFDRPASKQFAKYFNDVIEKYKERERKFLKDRFGNKWDEEKYDSTHKLKVESRHIDGSMNATEKDSLLNWLREEPKSDTCKILFNVRCLSEGVDVPSLDAVIFLSPRRSAVDVVQTVGRVMRIAPGKKRGYVILPIVVPTKISPDLVLSKNKEFDVVWQILNALKSIDPTFGRAVDGETGKINSDRIEVISISNQKFTHRTGAGSTSTASYNTKKQKNDDEKRKQKISEYHETDLFGGFGRNEITEEVIKSCIVKRVGNRREWEDWAEEVGQICQTQINHIKNIIENDTNSKKALNEFMDELKNTLNGEVTEDSVIEMLGQHVVIKPVLEAIFNEYPFAEENPISKAMTRIIEKLDEAGMKRCVAMLENFYGDVRRRMTIAKENDTRQTIIKDLFDRFFKTAFPKMRDKLGIVYTPIEIVDFIINSVNDLLKKEFKRTINEHGLHILDPFTGTGTFIVRLLESGFIDKENLVYKYENDIHANEIVPLAYYIAAMNIETSFHNIEKGRTYKPNEILVWTDTFSESNKDGVYNTELLINNDKLNRENNSDIQIILGNPPYSACQSYQNDNNANEHYDKLDKRLKETYVAGSNSTNKNRLFDSYIRAYRWASDRIKDTGIIGFITNAGWLETTSASGMRKCMVEEFSSIYIYHLKGNQRSTIGEQSRKEGGKIFGEGSRSPIAIVFLIRNPAAKEWGKIYFHSVGDYLTREQKLKEIANFSSISNMTWDKIIPDKDGDWLNQKNQTFEIFMPLFDKNHINESHVFKSYVTGLVTARDSWVYSSDITSLKRNLSRTISAYNRSIDKCLSGEDLNLIIKSETRDISWTRGSKTRFKRLEKISYIPKKIVIALYRPFIFQYLYYDKHPCFVEMPGRWTEYKSNNKIDNLFITFPGVGNRKFCCLMTDAICDFNLLEAGVQALPKFIYLKDGTKIDSITDYALNLFNTTYNVNSISKEDIFYYIYGIFHSEDYRKEYSINLNKETPRLPRVKSLENFIKFSKVGKNLANIHVNFEKQKEYNGVTIIGEEFKNYRVTQMKWGKIPGRTGNASKDKTTLIYNENIIVTNIPLEAQDYIVNRKSALDWIVERACVSTDKKSGIVNDFNKYGLEQGNPRYPLSLFLKIITVSLETIKLVRSLPKLVIHPNDIN